MNFKPQNLKKLLAKIEEFNTIIVFRHDSPDFDALGSQWGLYHFLKDNFPKKRILVTGDSNAEVGHNLFPKDKLLSEAAIKKEPFLALVLDTATGDRVSDKRYTQAAYVIRIDHHPSERPYGDLVFCDTDAAAVGELLYRLLTTPTFKKYKLNKEAARFLCVAIVGDTGGFENSNTGSSTLIAVGELLARGFRLAEDVYQPMFSKTIADFEAEKYIMSNCKITKKGVAYYYLNQPELKKFGMDSDDAKKYLGLFKFCEGINIWVCFAQDERKGNYRVSIRSAGTVINGVAGHFGGGGHPVASGARAADVAESLKIIKELDALL